MELAPKIYFFSGPGPIVLWGQNFFPFIFKNLAEKKSKTNLFLKRPDRLGHFFALNSDTFFLNLRPNY